MIMFSCNLGWDCSGCVGERPLKSYLQQSLAPTSKFQLNKLRCSWDAEFTPPEASISNWVGRGAI